LIKNIYPQMQMIKTNRIISNKVFILSVSIFIFLLFNQCKSPSKGSSGQNKNQSNSKLKIQDIEEQKEFDKYYFEGEKQKQINNYTVAINNFLQALKIKANSPAVAYEVASIYFNQNKVKMAETYAAFAYESNPNNKWYAILYTDILQSLKKYDKATKIFEDLVNQYPQIDDYYISLSELYMKAGKSNDALKVLNKMEAQFGQVETVVYTKYKFLILAKKYNEAITEIKKLIALNPENITYLKILAQAYDAAGDDKEAFAIYKKIDQISPGNGLSYLGQAEYYMKKGQNDSVRFLMSNAFRSNEITFDDKYQILVDLYFKNQGSDSNMIKDGIYLSKIIYQIHPKESKILSLLGDAYSKMDKNDSALYFYKQVLNNRKDIYELWVTILSLELVTKKYDDLMADSKNAIELYPNQPNLYFYRGLTLLELKKYQDAINTFTTGVGLVYNNNTLEASFYTNIAEANSKLGNLEEAYTNYEKAIAIDEKNNLALNNYAYSLVIHLKNLAKAEEMSKKTITAEPENPSYLDTYGWILFKSGKYKEAEKYISRALALASTSAEVMEHYGDILFKLGRIDDAITYWKKAIEAGSENKDIERKIKERQL